MTAPGHQVQCSRGQPRAVQDLVQQMHRERRGGRWLQDRRVAGDEGAHHHPRADGQGKIERADDRPYAVRPQAKGDLLALVCRPRGPLEAFVPSHLLAVEGEKIDRLVHVGHRLVPRLPVVEGDGGRQLELLLPHQLRRPLEDLHPLLPVHAGPRGERAPGRADGPRDLFRGRALEPPDDHVLLDRTDVIEGLLRQAGGAPDVVRIDDRSAPHAGEEVFRRPLIR